MTKAIITDLDRTLLRNDKSLSEYTVKTLLECKKKGILLVAATARPGRAIRDYDNAIGFDATVTLNGAVVTFNGHSENSFIEKTDVERIIKALISLGDCVVSLETTQGIFSNVDIPEWSPVVCENLLNVPVLNEVFKILVSSEKHDLRDVLSDTIGPKAYYSIANGNLFQIMSSEATKWHGIEVLLKAYKTDAKDIIYFGDDYDDIEPIRQSGMGIAVSNSIEEVKKIADCIIDSNENDGVAKYINAEVLKNEK